MATSTKDYIDISLQIANFVVLVITAVIVYLYTRAAQRSNEIQEEPVINLSYQPTAETNLHHPDGTIMVKNIGNGPAYEISFQNIELPEEGREGLFSYRFYIDSQLLESGHDMLLKMFIRTPGGGTEGSGMSRFLFRLVPQNMRVGTVERHRNNPAIFLVHYFGMDRKLYHSIFIFYSELAPVGDMVMQYVHRGTGRLSLQDARQKIAMTEKIRSHVEG